MPDSSKTALIPVLAILVVLSAIALTYITAAWLRHKYKDPRYIPTKYLKERWRRWEPRRFKKNGGYTPGLNHDHDNDSAPTLYLNRSARSSQLHDLERGARPGSTSEIRETDVNGVQRNTSVRSVMTLPTYSKSVRESEQILGREGERDGIDVVVEAPETAEEVEDRREEEMDSLYQIREVRRQEIADRNNRRERRREARERRDHAALSALRQESILRAREREATGAAAMIVEHQSRSRERRVSSVSYADVGLARHDGTRLRANSGASDRQPLLDSAASISGQSLQPAHFRDSLSTHHRGRSGSSILSGASSDMEDRDGDMPPFGRAGSDFEVVTLNTMHSRNPSQAATPSGRRSRASSHVQRPSIDTTDLGDQRIPAADPPSYSAGGFEEAPAYVSPATERARQSLAAQTRPDQPSIHIRGLSANGAPMLPEIGSLPSIRIAEATPIEPRSQQDFPPT